MYLCKLTDSSPNSSLYSLQLLQTGSRQCNRVIYACIIYYELRWSVLPRFLKSKCRIAQNIELHSPMRIRPCSLWLILYESVPRPKRATFRGSSGYTKGLRCKKERECRLAPKGGRSLAED